MLGDVDEVVGERHNLLVVGERRNLQVATVVPGPEVEDEAPSGLINPSDFMCPVAS
jgi:hypothetical protein